MRFMGWGEAGKDSFSVRIQFRVFKNGSLRTFAAGKVSMIHYSCDCCKRALDSEDLRYVVKMEVYAAIDPASMDDVDDDRDHLQEIQEILHARAMRLIRRSAATSTNSCGSTCAPNAARSSSRIRWVASTRSNSTSARTRRNRFGPTAKGRQTCRWPAFRTGWELGPAILRSVGASHEPSPAAISASAIPRPGHRTGARRAGVGPSILG